MPASRFGAIVVDCLTLWLSNLMLAGVADIARETANVVACRCGIAGTVLLVTNEVGCGIVRRTRWHADSATGGSMNQQAAAAAHEAYWMVFGVPMRIK